MFIPGRCKRSRSIDACIHVIESRAVLLGVLKAGASYLLNSIYLLRPATTSINYSSYGQRGASLGISGRH